MMLEIEEGVGEFDGVVPEFRRLRHLRGKSQKAVATAAKIGTHRFRKLEGEIGRYALRPPEARAWAKALDADLDETLLQVAGFYDVLAKGLGFSLATYAGRSGGEERALETSPVRSSDPDPEDEALAWAALDRMTDLSGYDETYSRPARRSEIDGWVRTARMGIAEAGGAAPDGLEQLPCYADGLLEE